VIPTTDAWFPPPVVVDDGACGEDDVPFDGRPGTAPAWCPKGDWPPETRYFEPAAPWPVVDQRLAAGVLGELALDLRAVDAAWRSSVLGEAGSGDWWWTGGAKGAGLRFSDAVDVGRLEAGDDCVVWGRHGELWVDDDCPVTSAGTATLRLFSADGPGDPDASWLVVVTGKLVHTTSPPAPTPARPSAFTAWIGWAAAAGVALMVPAAWTLGKASALAAPVAAGGSLVAAGFQPAASPAPGDAGLRAQVALLALPALREAAQQLISGLPAHGDRVAAVLSDSRAARDARELPAAYREAWEHAEASAALAHVRCDVLARTMAAALQDPEAFVASAHHDVVAVWRALFPATEVTPTDGGRALADQLVADVVREAVVAPLALAQLVYEAVPIEIPGPGPAGNAGAVATLATDVGWSYDHVPLYARTDAEFLLDDATVSGVRGEDVLLGVPAPAEARPGVIVRVNTPVLRPPPDRPGIGRGHLLAWRAA
jgi:hypothetical protein